MKKLAAIVLIVLAVASSGDAAVRGRARPDRVAPIVALGTHDGDVLVSNPTPLHSDIAPIEIRGTARDSASGIKDVTLHTVPCIVGDAKGCAYVSVETVLHAPGILVTSCAAGARTCTWYAPAPTAPGTYLVVAFARDRAGNHANTNLITIRVI